MELHEFFEEGGGFVGRGWIQREGATNDGVADGCGVLDADPFDGDGLTRPLPLAGEIRLPTVVVLSGVMRELILHRTGGGFTDLHSLEGAVE